MTKFDIAVSAAESALKEEHSGAVLAPCVDVAQVIENCKYNSNKAAEKYSEGGKHRHKKEAMFQAGIASYLSAAVSEGFAADMQQVIDSHDGSDGKGIMKELFADDLASLALICGNDTVFKNARRAAK